TVTYTYAVGGDPLVNAVGGSDWGTDQITTIVDLLGRTISYTDIWGAVTDTEFDLAGRSVETDGPLGTIVQNYDPDNGRADTTVVNSLISATPTYDAAGRLSAVEYLNGALGLYSYDDFGRPEGV